MRNARISLLTRMQEWDYSLGIAAVKRLLPITLLICESLRLLQGRRVFGPHGLELRSNRFGCLPCLPGYQVLCSDASLVGYMQFLAGSAHSWK